MEDYAELVSELELLGFAFSSYDEFSKGGPFQRPVCALMHIQPDYTEECLEMAALEHSLGVSSNFFFSPEMVKKSSETERLKGYGHNIYLQKPQSPTDLQSQFQTHWIDDGQASRKPNWNLHPHPERFSPNEHKKLSKQKSWSLADLKGFFNRESNTHVALCTQPKQWKY